MTDPTLTLTDDGPNGDDRRGTAYQGVHSPERLMLHQIEQTRRQLSDAREQRDAAQERVVQLEDAIKSWEHLACELWERRGHLAR